MSPPGVSCWSVVGLRVALHESKHLVIFCFKGKISDVIYIYSLWLLNGNPQKTSNWIVFFERSRWRQESICKLWILPTSGVCEGGNVLHKKKDASCATLVLPKPLLWPGSPKEFRAGWAFSLKIFRSFQNEYFESKLRVNTLLLHQGSWWQPNRQGWIDIWKRDTPGQETQQMYTNVTKSFFIPPISHQFFCESFGLLGLLTHLPYV